MLNIEEVGRRQNKKISMVHHTMIQAPVSTKSIPLPEDYPSYQLYLKYSRSIEKQYNELKHYLEDLQSKLQHVKEDQIDCLSVKHRYYIRKFRKYSEEQQRLLEIFNNLPTTVLESPSVQQETKSINFIEMVSADTQNKLQQLKQVVQKAEAKKAQNQLNIKILRQQLNIYKKQYFQKKRQEAKLLKQIQGNKNKKCMQQIDKLMKKIRFQKRQKLQQMRKSFNHVVSTDKFKMSGLSYRAQQKNTMKSQTLQPIKPLQESRATIIIKKSITCENFTKNKTNHSNNSSAWKHPDENTDPLSDQTNVNTSLLTNQQILKKLNKKSSLRQQFKQQSSESILKLIIEYGKINELIQIIDKENVPMLLECCKQNKII